MYLVKMNKEIFVQQVECTDRFKLLRFHETTLKFGNHYIPTPVNTIQPPLPINLSVIILPE